MIAVSFEQRAGEEEGLGNRRGTTEGVSLQKGSHRGHAPRFGTRRDLEHSPPCEVSADVKLPVRVPCAWSWKETGRVAHNLTWCPAPWMLAERRSS